MMFWLVISMMAFVVSTVLMFWLYSLWARSTSRLMELYSTRIRDLEYGVINNGCRVDEVWDDVKSNLKDVAKDVCELQDEGAVLVETIRSVEAKIPQYVTCETCGCMVTKDVAVRGESVIEQGYLSAHDIICKEKYSNESIREVYYCKEHAPEEL